MIRKLLPLIVDRELDQETEDAFGHKHFSELLERVIVDQGTTLPYSIGLLGGWGTGKSSIKELTQKRLVSHNEKNGNSVKCITFNAWRFGGENLKRALLREVFIELDGSEEDIEDALSRYKIGDEAVAKPLREWWREVWEAWGLRLLFGLVIYSAILALTIAFASTPVLSVLTTGLLTLVTAAIAGWLLNLDKLFVSRLTRVWRAEPPRSSAEEFEQLLIKRLENFHNDSKTKSITRIAVFVDDLDRLSSDEMIAGLEAIRSFLELPRHRLPDGVGLIFVVSCDEHRIAEALAKRAIRGDVPLEEHNRQQDARRYLDRVFQYRLEIPPLPHADMRQYAKRKLEQHALEFISKFTAHGDEIEDVLERLVHTGVTNPRQALQLINALLQAWWVAEVREFEGIGNANAGGLAQGSVTKYPQALAVICVLRVDFPDFYRQLEAEPRLLEAFRSRYLNTSKKEQPDEIERLLKQFADEGNTSKLAVKFRTLRSYLSSVQGVRMPRLEPLLRLSEDAISRVFGDGANNVYDALVNGDAEQILEEFGRGQNSDPLTMEQARLLRGLLERLDQDTAPRIVNAAGALASIATRIPDSVQKEVLSKVATWAVSNPEVRTRIGSGRFSPIFIGASDDDKTELLDLLTQHAFGGDLTPTGASDQEKMEDCLHIFDIVLFAKGRNSLPLNLEQKWRSWIHKRQIADTDEPVLMKEIIVRAKDNSVLTTDWASNFIDGVFESNILEREDEELTFDYLALALDHQATYGNFVGWNHFENLIDISSPSEVRFAIKFLETRFSILPIELKEKIVLAFSKCLDTFLSLTDEQILTYGEIKEPLSKWLNGYFSQLSSNAQKLLIPLAVTAGTIAVDSKFDSQSFALEIVEYFRRENVVGFQDLLKSWLTLFPEKTVNDVDEYIGKNWADISINNRKTLIEKLHIMSDKPDITKDSGVAWRNIVKNINPEIGGKELQGFLEKVWTNAGNFMSPSYRQWYSEFFPTLASLISFVPVKAGDTLQSLFANAASYPDQFAELCKSMKQHWFGNAKNAYGTVYNPDSIASLFNSQLRNYYSQPYATDVFYAFAELVQKNLVSDAQRENLVAIAVIAQSTHPLVSLDVAAVCLESLTVDQISNLAQNANLDDQNQIKALLHLFFEVSRSKNAYEFPEDYTIALLNITPKEHGGERDFLLKIWIENLEISSAITDLVADEKLNDSQSNRLLEKIENSLTSDQYSQILPKLLEIINKPITQHRLLDLDISHFSGSETNKIAKTYSEAFSGAKSGDHQKILLEKLSALRQGNSKVGEQVLKDYLKTGIKLSEQQSELVRREFPKLKSVLEKYNISS